jgi:lauroyl/myristoyl acyltransferase
MLRLDSFARNYAMFKDFKQLNYDPEKVCKLFRDWINLDIEKSKTQLNTISEISQLIDNINFAKDLGMPSAILATKILQYRIDDELDCCMAYLFGSNLDWLRSQMVMDETTKDLIKEIKESDTPSIFMIAHHGPFRAFPAFLQLFEKKFTFTHTENDYLEPFFKHGVIKDPILGIQFGENFIPKIAKAYQEGSNILLVGDYSLSPRKSDRQTTMYGRDIHAPSGPARFAHKMNTSLYSVRLIRTGDCKFEFNVSKIADKANWNTLGDEKQIGAVVESCFDWVRETVKLKPEAWQTWYRFKQMCLNE